MPIAFSCASCGKSYRVGDKFAGRIAKCKQCGNSCWVPSGAEIEKPKQPVTQLVTGTAIENASNWFAGRFGIRPVWPVTIATLGVIVGWLASQNRDLPEVQAVAKHAFGAEHKEVNTSGWSPNAVDSIAEIEKVVATVSSVWTPVLEGSRTYECDSGAVVAFGDGRMSIILSKNSGEHPHVSRILLLCSTLGGDEARSVANASRLAQWLEQYDEKTIELYGATVHYGVEDEITCFIVTERQR